WDGSSDVPVSNGSGSTTTLASMGLASLADLAVHVKATPAFPAVTVNAVRLLLRSNVVTSACAPATKPAFCARVRPLSEIITRQELARINPPAGTTLAAVAALPTIGLDLAPAEATGLYRLGAAEQAVLAEMIASL